MRHGAAVCFRAQGAEVVEGGSANQLRGDPRLRQLGQQRGGYPDRRTGAACLCQPRDNGIARCCGVGQHQIGDAFRRTRVGGGERIAHRTGKAGAQRLAATTCNQGRGTGGARGTWRRQWHGYLWYSMDRAADRGQGK